MQSAGDLMIEQDFEVETNTDACQNSQHEDRLLEIAEYFVEDQVANAVLGKILSLELAHNLLRVANVHILRILQYKWINKLFKGCINLYKLYIASYYFD